MFVTKYTITNKILRNIGVIDGAKEVIHLTPLITAWVTRLKRESLERSIYHSTHLEGNSLQLDEVRDVLDSKDVNATHEEIQEIKNYRNALKFIDHICSQIGSASSYVLTLETILEFHHQVVARLIPEHLAGYYRTRQLVLKNARTGEVSYTPPPAAEVPYLMEDLLNWINSEESREVHPVIKAGIIHLELSRIHPYTVGNGRVARLVSQLILSLEGYNLLGFASIDEFFDSDSFAYFSTLQAVFNQNVIDTHERDLTPWLEYFTEGVAVEFNKTKERVKRVSTDAHVKDKLGDQVVLNERQMMIMEYLHRHKQMKNSDFRKIFPDFSDDTVLRELRFLKQKGLIKKEGGTKKATYVLK